MPGFGKPRRHALGIGDTTEFAEFEAWIAALRQYLPSEIKIAIDLNYNVTQSTVRRIAERFKDYDLAWIERDNQYPRALGLSANSGVAFATGENLLGLQSYLPLFSFPLVDLVIVDLMWNGFLESCVISDVATRHDVGVLPHNFSSHLATFMALNFAAVCEGVELLELDYDVVSWKDSLVSVTPEVTKSEVQIPLTPGWGTEPLEDALEEFQYKPT
jgi:L-alanine-DL-glutamate epimerase-like enolase superfamily enzyme